MAVSTSYYANSYGPISCFDGTAGRQIYIPLSAITITGGAAHAPGFPSFEPWLNYLLGQGVVWPGPAIPTNLGPTGPTGSNASSLPAGPSGPTGG